MAYHMQKDCEPQHSKEMTPIDPVESASADPRSPMAPPYVDENPNLTMVEQGMDAAENEVREAVTDGYEASAKLSDDKEAELDDIDFTDADDSTTAPEVAAIHEEFILSDEYEDKDEEDEDFEDDE